MFINSNPIKNMEPSELVEQFFKYLLKQSLFLPSLWNVILPKCLGEDMKSSELVVIDLFREQRARWKLSVKINYSFMFVSHLRSVWHVVLRNYTVFCFFEQKLDVFCRILRSTTSKSMISTTTVSLTLVKRPKYGDTSGLL